MPVRRPTTTSRRSGAAAMAASARARIFSANVVPGRILGLMGGQ